jgi:hypothetical protein
LTLEKGKVHPRKKEKFALEKAMKYQRGIGV